MTFEALSPDRQMVRVKNVWRQTERNPSPPIGFRPIVHSFHSQSVAPPHSELHTWCHSNDPGAVKTGHSIVCDYEHIQMTKFKLESETCYHEKKKF